jgi:DNA-binding response OmpR family regulator
MLSVFGFSVETYDSADTFLQAIDQPRSGCVVADVRMPGTDGIELVRELGRRKIALPVVLISGHADVPMAVAAIKSGAEDFIEKPVDDVQLVAAINRALARTFEQLDLRKSQEGLGLKFARLTPRQVEILPRTASSDRPCRSFRHSARLVGTAAARFSHSQRRVVHARGIHCLIGVSLRGRSPRRWHNTLGRSWRIRVDLGCRRDA